MLNVFKDNLTHLPYVIGKHVTTKGKGKMINFTDLSQKYIESFTFTITKLCWKKIMEQQESFSSVDPFHEKSQEKAHNCCFYIHLKGRKRTKHWRWFSKISSSSTGIKCWKQKGYNVRALVKKYESNCVFIKLPA